MKLSDWLGHERGRSAALAVRLNIKPPQVAGWVSGEKPVPVRHMAAIEDFTGAQVTRQEMRPDDWQDIWPELAEPQAPTPAQNPPADAAPGAAAGGDTGAAWGGVERRDPHAGPMAFPDLERRAEVL